MRNEAESAVWRLLYPESQEAFQKVSRTHYMQRGTGRLGKAAGSAPAGEEAGDADTEIWVGESALTQSTIFKGVH